MEEPELPDFTNDDIDKAMQEILIPILNSRVMGGGAIPSVMPLALVAMAINLAAQWCDEEKGYDAGLEVLQQVFDNYSTYCRAFASKTNEEKESVRKLTTAALTAATTSIN